MHRVGESCGAKLGFGKQIPRLNSTEKSGAPPKKVARFSLLQQFFAETSPTPVNLPKKKRGRCQWPLDFAMTSDLRGGASFWRSLIFGRSRIRALPKENKQTWRATSPPMRLAEKRCVRATSLGPTRLQVCERRLQYGLGARCRFVNSRGGCKHCI